MPIALAKKLCFSKEIQTKACFYHQRNAFQINK